MGPQIKRQGLSVCLRVSKVVISGLQSCKRALLWSRCVCAWRACLFFCFTIRTHTERGRSVWVRCLHSESGGA